MPRYRKLKIATAALVVVSGLLASTPSAGAATTVSPVVRIVPAFDKDLPLSGYQWTSGASVNASAAITPSAAWVCTVYASDPGRFANTIDGEGFQTCSGTGWSPQRVRVTLQRYLGLGFWSNLTIVDSGYVYVNAVDRNFIYDCSNLGTQTYRVITDGYAVGGAYHASVQSLNYLTVTC
ncbi:MAG: hypothetical protein HY050_09435 [Actinobacteria bacterium]|nr:hypothetical protein [Actinomycetota bacterium]